ncbi:MAG: cation diffusion facilitator family transporter [Ruminiclostridium sp.]|nr:cation diffusion facilitator family transporter [Ruminiclostridium sp.]
MRQHKKQENIENNKNDHEHNRVMRERYGRISSIIGISVNIFLFITKFIAGTLTGSVSIVGDAVNNLSDAGSSVISFISFRYSKKPADDGHPFGHARIEYIGSTAVAVSILFIGLELVKSSVVKILNPVAIDFSFVTLCILLFSIIAKFTLYRYNAVLAKRIDSSILQATSFDSLSDVLATSVVLASAVISHFSGVQLDGYMGVAVAVFIIVSGINILKNTVSSILGKGPSEELINLIESFIKKYEGVIGLHDLVVHDYGPNHCFASVHVEVDSNVDILESHDLIDNIERDISLEHGIHLVIHLDPIVTDDPFVDELRMTVKNIVLSLDESLSIHDFRVVKGSTHNNLIFDVLVPNECKISNSVIQGWIMKKIHDIDKKLYVVVTLDRSYVSSPNQKLKNN